MGDRPIIFSAPMVRAILAGRKTQTRRVIKPQPRHGATVFQDGARGVWFAHTKTGPGSDCVEVDAVEPGYSIGDRLWVREAWRVGAWDHNCGRMCIDFRSDGAADPIWRSVPDPDWFEHNWIKISDELDRKAVPTNADGQYLWKRGEAPLSWRPGIHMPRWASRLTLTVTDVRVQRLQEISEEDARAEGVLWVPGHGEIKRADLHEGFSNYLNCREGFQVLWDSLNASRGFGWDASPWVVALTFTVHHGNIDALEVAA